MNASAGRKGHRWRTVKAQHKAQCRMINAECWICHGAHGPINYAAGPNARLGFESDHYYPVNTHPHLANEPSNLRPSHVKCNRGRGDAHPSLVTHSAAQGQWVQAEEW